MDPRLVFLVFIGAGVAYTGVWAWVILNSHTRQEYSKISEGMVKLRRRLFYGLLSAVVIVFLLTLALLPYAPVKTFVVGSPRVAVTVVASQYIWNISQHTLPVGVVIEFDVTSTDVNHGFGIYSPEGILFAQVQAMPGYVNKLIVVFERPGIYPIHCLEYCGVDHHEMESSIEIR